MIFLTRHFLSNLFHLENFFLKPIHRFLTPNSIRVALFCARLILQRHSFLLDLIMFELVLFIFLWVIKICHYFLLSLNIARLLWQLHLFLGWLIYGLQRFCSFIDSHLWLRSQRQLTELVEYAKLLFILGGVYFRVAPRDWVLNWVVLLFVILRINRRWMHLLRKLLTFFQFWRSLLKFEFFLILIDHWILNL